MDFECSMLVGKHYLEEIEGLIAIQFLIEELLLIC